jgi:hypothetical protein
MNGVDTKKIGLYFILCSHLLDGEFNFLLENGLI